MDASRVQRIREDMERAEARRLQPHYIESFFLEAFQRLGGTVKQREPRRYEVTHVPAPVRNRDRLIGIGEPVLPRYERIAFEKSLVAPQGQPLAAFVCPGHPLLDAVIDLTLERHRDLLSAARCWWTSATRARSRACSSTSSTHPGREPHRARASAASSPSGCSTSSSTPTGTTRHLHYAPYLDYRPLAEDEPGVDAILARPECAWISRELEQKAQGYAIAHVVPEHLAEVRDRKLELIAKTEAAVKDRLTKEITYWDHRAEQLKLQEQAGKPNARLNSGEARKRADDLQARLQKRLEELKLEAQISPLPPVVLGGLLVVPAGLLAADDRAAPLAPTAPVDTQASGRAGARHRHGDRAQPRLRADRPRVREARLRHREPRPRHRASCASSRSRAASPGADTITVTKNEILYSLNKPDDFILAIVEFLDGDRRVHYLRSPFQREPDFGVTSVNYAFAELLRRAAMPS